MSTPDNPMDHFTTILRTELGNVETTLGNKILKLADNFNKTITEEINKVSATCLGWFNQLKGFVDTNATDIKKLGEDLQALRHDFEEEKRKNSQLNSQLQKLQGELDYQTEHSYRLNLVVYNIEESADKEDCFLTMKNFMQTQLQIEETVINQLQVRDCHRLGGQKAEGKIRPIVIAFTLQQQRDFVLKQGKNLRNTNYSIQPHLPQKMVIVKKQLLAKRKDIKRRDHRILAFIGYRAYRPVLLVKVNGKLKEFDDNMNLAQLQYSDQFLVPSGNLQPGGPPAAANAVMDQQPPV